MMRIHEQNSTTIVVPQIQGLTSCNARQFQEQIELVLRSTSQVAIDMSPLEFVDSAGLAVLLRFMKRAPKMGSTFRLFGMTPPVRTIFSLVGMDRVLRCLNDREKLERQPGSARKIHAF